MMRILHCIPSMGGGGAERQLCYMAEQMSRDGLDVHVAYFQDGANSKRLKISGAQIHHLSCLNNYDPMIICKIVRIIRKINPQIVQTWITQIDILAGIASILTKTPFIVSERNSSLAYGYGWKDRIRIAIGRRADAIISNSKKGIKYWANKVKKPELKVIRNSIPFDEILKTPKFLLPSMLIDESNEIIIFAGSYNKQKNLYNLFCALQQVLTKRENAVALFFGNGPQRESLINLKNQYDIRDRIKILGYSSELWNWFKVADVFVSISYFEGTPNTVLEAVASKCPIVISDIPEHREILDDNSSYFVPVSNTKAIANGIIKALSDPYESKRRAASAYNKIKDWTVKSVTNEYITFYNLILNKKGN